MLTVPVVSGAESLDQAQSYVAGYARVPEYARSLRRQRLNVSGEPDLTPAANGAGPADELLDSDMVRALVLSGEPATGQAGAAAFAAAGVDTLLLLPIRPRHAPTNGFESAAGVLRRWAPTLVPG